MKTEPSRNMLAFISSLAAVGPCWPSLAVIGCCGPCCEPALACIGCCGLSLWAIVGIVQAKGGYVGMGVVSVVQH